MASKSSGSSLSKLEIKLIVAEKMLLHLPSSTAELLNVLKDIEQILSGVQQAPSKSINNAMYPIIEAMIAKELVKHPDMDVNISVASCICEIMRIMAPESPYNNEQRKDFFEMVVFTFEKLSSVSGGCYTKMTKVLKLFSDVRLAVLMLDLDEVLDGLVIRLFKQFLSVADSNSSAIVHEMEKIMTVIIEEGEDLTHELLGLIVTSVKNDNQSASPVCVQLGKKVLMNCAAQQKPQLPDMGRDINIALYDYSKAVAHICKTSSENDIMEAEESIPLITEISKLRKDTTHKIEVGCLETVRRCQHEKKTLSFDDPPLPPKSVTDVKGKRKRSNTPLKKQEAKEKFPLTTEISKLTKDTTVRRCQRRKKTASFEDSPLPSKSVAEVKGKRKRNNSPLKKQAQSVEYGENLVGSRIKVWWPADKTYYEGVVKSFDCVKVRHKVLYDDDGFQEILNLKSQKWELVEKVSPKSDCLEPPLPKKVLSPQSDIIPVQGYNVKKNIAPMLEAIFKKHGDIAKCNYQIASVRTSFLEVVCEVVRRIQTDNITTIISEMKEIESQVSAVEAANIDVSWLRAYLADIDKTKEAMENSTLLTEMKANTILVKTAARLDLKESREELIAAQERFKKAERCVEVLDLVEEKLNNILKCKAEKDSWVKQPIL